ncbi:MAG: MFS transporter [Deltaproteobacteria bacterium]|nr:MAG: MFS transporter [Deltaproteobacteria bacterium]
MTLTPEISNRNFVSFLWHASFLAFAQVFMDVDTIIPAMLIESGGGAIHIGIMTAILLGGSSVTQLFFAPYISNQSYKKKYLLLGINSRIFSLLGLGFLLFYLQARQPVYIIGVIFILITIFALGGAFANIGYTDILGKSIVEEKRKSFLSFKQIIAGIVVLFSAFLARKVLSSASFPLNYAYTFIIGSSALLIASLGFWNLKETEPSVLKISGFKKFIQILKSELKTNPKLSYFLGFVNTQGIAISFLPFLTLYAKKTFQTQSNDIAMFLVFKVLGIVLVSFLILLWSKKIKYKWLLYGNVLLSLTMVLGTLFISEADHIKYIFISGGIVYSIFSITMNGVLLEVSGKENRAIYTGFAGAGSVIPAIFPLTAGYLIKTFGFQNFFLLYIVIISFSVFFIYKLDCKK